MSATTELTTSSKESEAKRQENVFDTLSQEPAGEQDDGFLSRALGALPDEPRACTLKADS